MSPTGANFEALDDFKTSLGEIDILCEAALNFREDKQKYATFNKAALLLIAGKFESFIESLLEEYIFKINQSAIPANKVPDPIRLHHSFYALRDFQNDQYRSRPKEAADVLTQLGKLWATAEPVSKLRFECKFSYGKHGEKELTKIFEKVGLSDLFEQIKLTETIETVSSDQPVLSAIDFRGIFNSVCSMRNNILHEDKSPSLNTEEIATFKKQFEQFAIGLDAYLTGVLPVHSNVDEPSPYQI